MCSDIQEHTDTAENGIRDVIISELKSPSIHFVIEHPKTVHALQNFTIPVVE